MPKTWNKKSKDRRSINNGVNPSGGTQIIQPSMQTVIFGNASSTPVSAPTRPWTVPRALTPVYTGREDIAAKLSTYFSPLNGRLNSPRKFFISGLGGTGKTEICIKYATSNRDNYWGVFWVDCTTETTASETFKRIGQICNLGAQDSGTVRNYLSSIEDRWLLILDSADDVDIKLNEFLPSGGQGDVITTTRNAKLHESFYGAGSVWLKQLEPKLAKILLLKAAGIPSGASKETSKTADSVVEQLGNHTIAVVQAGAFIQEFSCSLEEYDDLLCEQKDRLLKFSGSQDTYRSVNATFEVSMQQLQIRAKHGHVAAAGAINVMKLLPFLNRKEPVEPMLIEAMKYLQEHKNQIESEDFLFHPICIFNPPPNFPFPFPGNFLPWRQACVLLEKLSLIRNRQQHTYSFIDMHLLVSDWIKQRMDLEARSEAWMLTASLLALACKQCAKYQQDYLYYPDYMRFGLQTIISGHIRTCICRINEAYLERISVRQLMEVLYRLYFGFNITESLHANRDTAFNAMFDYILNDDFCGPDNPEDGDPAIVSLFDPKITAKSQSRYSKKEQARYCEYLVGLDLVVRWQRKCAINMFSFLIKEGKSCRGQLMHLAIREYAEALLQDKQGNQAIEFLKKAIASLPKTDEVNSLRYREQLGILLRKKQRWEESAAVLEPLILQLRQQLPVDSSRLIDLEVNLGRVYLYMGEHEKAKPVFKSIVKRAEKILPKKHQTMSWLTDLLDTARKRRGLLSYDSEVEEVQEWERGHEWREIP